MFIHIKLLFSYHEVPVCWVSTVNTFRAGGNVANKEVSETLRLSAVEAVRSTCPPGLSRRKARTAAVKVGDEPPPSS